MVVGVRLLERAEETAQPKRLAPKELDTLVRTTYHLHRHLALKQARICLPASILFRADCLAQSISTNKADEPGLCLLCR